MEFVGIHGWISHHHMLEESLEAALTKVTRLLVRFQFNMQYNNYLRAHLAQRCYAREHYTSKGGASAQMIHLLQIVQADETSVDVKDLDCVKCESGLDVIVKKEMFI